MQFAQGQIISFLRSWNSNPDVHVLQKTIHPLPLKMSVLLFTMWVWRSNGIPNSPTSPLARGPFPPQEEPLGSCTLRCMGWGLPWGAHHVPGSSRVHVTCGFSTLKETARKWLACLTPGPFPQIHESDQAFFPRGKCQGWRGYEGSGEKGRTIFLILPREPKFLFNTERGRIIALLQPSEET